MAKRLRVDFSLRDEQDRLPIPSAELEKISSKERVILFDDDMAVRGYVLSEKNNSPRYFQIQWDTVEIASWKAPPPSEVQGRVEPIMTRREWPMT